MGTLNGIRAKDVVYQETRRGIAYTGIILMGNKPIGVLEHKGDGGSASVYIHEERNKKEFYKRKDEYQKEITDDEFVQHLLDMLDFGKVLTDEEKMQLLTND